MTTNDPENKATTKSRRQHTHLLLRLAILLIGGLTAGTVLHITISPVITVGTQGTAQESPAASGKTEPGGFNHTNAPGFNAAADSSHFCGYPTLKGRPCRNRLRAPGYCWIHKNRP